MSEALAICENQASVAQLADHLRACDEAFVPPLSTRKGIDDYADKIAASATRFEAWVAGRLVGLVATYCNDIASRVAFVTSVSVLPAWQGQGIASQLLEHCVRRTIKLGFARIDLEVDQDNVAAIALYERHGFSVSGRNDRSATMSLAIE